LRQSIPVPLIGQALALLSVVAVLRLLRRGVDVLWQKRCRPFEDVKAHVTPELGAFGKVLIALMMFLGRVGPLTLLLALRARPGLAVQLPGGCYVGMSRQFAVIGMGRLRVSITLTLGHDVLCVDTNKDLIQDPPTSCPPRRRRRRRKFRVAGPGAGEFRWRGGGDRGNMQASILVTLILVELMR